MINIRISVISKTFSLVAPWTRLNHSSSSPLLLLLMPVARVSGRAGSEILSDAFTLAESRNFSRFMKFVRCLCRVNMLKLWMEGNEVRLCWILHVLMCGFYEESIGCGIGFGGGVLFKFLRNFRNFPWKSFAEMSRAFNCRHLLHRLIDLKLKNRTKRYLLLKNIGWFEFEKLWKIRWNTKASESEINPFQSN